MQDTRMALKRRLQDEGIAQELILDSDSDADTCQEDISPYTDTDSAGDNRVDTQ
jgi:hypothetical protein